MLLMMMVTMMMIMRRMVGMRMMRMMMRRRMKIRMWMTMIATGSFSAKNHQFGGPMVAHVPSHILNKTC
jgi:hypothetical protein